MDSDYLKEHKKLLNLFPDQIRDKKMLKNDYLVNPQRVNLLEKKRAHWVELTHERLQLLFMRSKSAFSGTKKF